MRLFKKGNCMLSTKLFNSYITQEENKQIMKICWKFTVSIESSKTPMY